MKRSVQIREESLGSAIIIREGNAADAPAIAALHVASWRDAYREILDPGFLAGPVEAERAALWIDRMARPKPNQLVLLAELEGELIGFVCAFMGDNLGRALLAEVARQARAAGTRSGLHLWVYEDNRPARAFYERLGGEAVERELQAKPGGGSAIEIRMHWPDPAALAG